MKNNPVVRNAIAELEENELFIASKFYKEKLFNQISEAAYYKTLQRMCGSGELVKIAKGTYHLPRMSKYGIVPPSEKEIIEAFTANNTGTVVGYTLYNSLNLTTQIPQRITVMSSAIEGLTKSIRNVEIYKVTLNFSNEITSMVQGLEVLQNFNTIQEINYAAFLKYTEKLAASFHTNAFEEVISVRTYKKSTISFLREILNHYHVRNNLDEHLSSLSEYKHPKMEELYEAARVS